MLIKINIENKHPQVDGTPVIVCGNNDYQIQFTFDEEWSHSQMKHARFAWRKGGKSLYIDVPFVGDTVDVPMLSEVHFVYVGVYTDSLHTTTPARIACEYSIRCNSGEDIQEPTPEDVLIDLFNMVTDLQGAAIEAADIATRERVGAESAAADAAKSEEDAREAAADALACVGTAVRVWEGNTRDAITFWAGTQAQYDALPEKVANCMYIITDDTTGEEIAAMCSVAEERAGLALVAAEAALEKVNRDLRFDLTKHWHFSWIAGTGGKNLTDLRVNPVWVEYCPTNGLVHFQVTMHYTGTIAKGETLGFYIYTVSYPPAPAMTFPVNAFGASSFDGGLSLTEDENTILTIRALEDVDTSGASRALDISGWYVVEKGFIPG